MDRIVVGIDRSASSAAALRWAAAQARMSGATLELVHAYRAPVAYTGPQDRIADVDPELHQTMSEALAALVAGAAADLAGIDVRHRLHPGRASDGLLEAAREADLLVVGTRGAGGFTGLRLGSTAGACVRAAACPVAVVPPTPRPGTGRVSVGVDGSATAAQASGWAVGEAQRRGADLEVIGVYHPYDEPGPYGARFMQIADPGATERLREEAEAHVATAVESLPAELRVHALVLAGPPAKVLVERTANTDLLVLGRHGREGHGSPYLGSIVRQVLHHTACPVVVVPRPG